MEPATHETPASEAQLSLPVSLQTDRVVLSIVKRQCYVILNHDTERLLTVLVENHNSKSLWIFLS